MEKFNWMPAPTMPEAQAENLMSEEVFMKYRDDAVDGGHCIAVGRGVDMILYPRKLTLIVRCSKHYDYAEKSITAWKSKTYQQVCEALNMEEWKPTVNG